MALTVLIGGVRSGKSELAVRIALQQRSPVTFLATGEPGDEEMGARIAQHRRERPAEWRTIEAPLALLETIAMVPDDSCLLIDCLTLWTANVLAARGAAAAEVEAHEAAARAAGRNGLTIAVSNEVGMGVVPENPLGREYRDLLGRVNAMWAETAENAYLMVAGRVLALHSSESVIGALR